MIRPDELSISGEEVADWPEEVWTEWAIRVAPRFKAGETCSSANYAPPRPWVDEYNQGTERHRFVYLVGQRDVCFVDWK